MIRKTGFAVALAAAALAGCSGSQKNEVSPDVGAANLNTLGERLFLDTRFAQFFATHSPDDVNAKLASGDPTVAVLQSPLGDLPGPFAGQSINCRQCHLVDEVPGQPPAGGHRTYADFARRSVRPDRGEGILTVRNSPPMVDATLPRDSFILHFDGEFTTIEDLVRGTLTGANFGWQPGEEAQALAHIAKVIREDDGSGQLAADEGGGAYRTAFSGTSSDLPIPADYRINVNTASDQQILDAIARFIGAYVDGLRFQRNAAGTNVGSPYDLFLALNKLPQAPALGESDLDYARRLRSALGSLANPQFVAPDFLRRFQFHAQPFQFEAQELAGLKAFLAEPAAAGGASASEVASGGVGNCVACHAPPNFSDHGLHNTGVTQREYDGIHGSGAFTALAIPSLAQRSDPAVAQQVLPATGAHPNYASRMRAIPSAADPGLVDLGAWNIFADADFPASQAPLRALLCAIVPGTDCAATGDDALLDRAVAVVKTPSLRDLGHSQPYMHDGAFDTFADVLGFYAGSSAQARAGTLRNGDPRLAGIAINAQDQSDLAAFLAALNEDYQ